MRAGARARKVRGTSIALAVPMNKFRCICSSLMTSTLALAAIVSLSACEEDPSHVDSDPDAGMCPAGPQAPLNTPCDNDGLTCRYGYNIPGCGGRTVVCRNGTWAEVEHTDPSASCGIDGSVLDGSVPDAGTDARTSDASDQSDAKVSGDAALACEAGLGMDASCAL